MTKSNIGPQHELSAYQQFKHDFLKENCTRCRLSRGRTHLVFDRGNPRAKILAIGEAPGAEEDKKGQCFVGRAGKVLDQVMSSIGLDTNKDLLIVNVVKCRPPDNRPPRSDEVAACRPYLEKQIQVMDPGIILLLGRTALKHILPERATVSLKQSVGKIFETNIAGLKTTPCMLLYHPAYLLYDPRKRAEMLVHLASLKKILNECQQS